VSPFARSAVPLSSPRSSDSYFCSRGSLYLIGSMMSREVAELWWLGAIIGSLEILLAFRISQSFIQTRVTLLVLWAGFMAIFRGFTDIVLALELRTTARAVSPV
jgi:uncharacterized membrane protein HdeD (DUF308 family)